MTVTLTIETQAPGEDASRMTLAAPAGPMTVADLIRAKTGAEWDARARGERQTFGREFAPPIPGETAEPRTRDEAIRAALDAFRAGWFVVFVDGDPAMALDTRLAASPDTRIRFVRLYPGRPLA